MCLSEDETTELLKMLLQEAVTEGGGSEPGDRLVNASSNGNFQEVREILEANPGKVINRSINQARKLASNQSEVNQNQS